MAARSVNEAIMKAVYCEKHTGIDDLVIREIPAPGRPGPGELRIDIKARGVAFTDVLMTRGEYQVKPPLPFIVGGEGAGIVTDVGEGVEGFAPGDLVLSPGGCVETVLVPADRVTRLPAGVDPVAAAAFRGNYHTAYYGLQRGRLQAGETLLVHGAAGGCRAGRRRRRQADGRSRGRDRQHRGKARRR